MFGIDVFDNVSRWEETQPLQKFEDEDHEKMLQL